MIRLVIIIWCLAFTEGSPPILMSCGPKTNDTNLQSNLNMLFANLVSEANSTGFSSKTINPKKQNEFSGLIMCYTDSPRVLCSDCLRNSTASAAMLCPGSSTATITYSYCFLRYSNINFIGVVTLAETPKLFRSQITVSNSRTLNKTVSELLSSLRLEAMNSKLLNAYGSKTEPTMNETVYGLVQCTRDLEPAKCGLCLQYTIGNLSVALTGSKPSKGATAISPNCYIRFEFYPLSLLSFTSPPPDAPEAPEAPEAPAGGSWTMRFAVPVICAIGAVIVAFLISFTCFCFWRKRRKSTEIDTNELGHANENEYANEQGHANAQGHAHEQGRASMRTERSEVAEDINAILNFRVFSLTELATATNYFSEENKLDQGGFGPVYKGTLPDGTQIAAKRLAAGSHQGSAEFKSEVKVLANLMHKNLVKLLGYCIDKNEKLLCYEYLPCRSLDIILFEKDKSNARTLSWKTRFKIIKGISNGLLYLHKESGPNKIIHRDLKPGNILLDEDMNPKISDFGLARLFKDAKTHKITSNVAGTWGYIAPEYYSHGTYSEKSDVYSFGIMLLEIATGKRNGRTFNLRENAWQHWENGDLGVLMEYPVDETCLKQVSRCIHIGLLCVQQNPKDRPKTEAVHDMLCNNFSPIKALPKYSRPPDLYFTEGSSLMQNTFSYWNHHGSQG